MLSFESTVISHSKSIEVDEPIPDSVILTKTEVFDYNSAFKKASDASKSYKKPGE